MITLTYPQYRIMRLYKDLLIITASDTHALVKIL